MMRSGISQGFIILALSLLFALAYNAVREDGIELMATREIATGEDMDEIYALLADSTVLIMPKMVDLELAKRLFDLGIAFLDARDQEEFAEGHIAGAENLSVVEIASRFDPSEPLVVYCEGRGCDVSLDLSETLMHDWQFTKILVFEGGWPEWKSAGYPVETRQ